MKKIQRRSFIKTTTLAGVSSLFVNAKANSFFKIINNSNFLSQVGVCTSRNNHELLVAASCNYIEESVSGLLMPNESDDKFASEVLSTIKTISLPIYACNSFIPGNLKSVGLEANHEAILKYVDIALSRAQKLDIKKIVFGSGGSRKIPEGFSKDEARKQFIQLGKQIALIASQYNIIICLEPLNSAETNIVNSVAEGAEIVKEINHDNFKLLADIFHMMREGEKPDEIRKAGGLLQHIHIAEKEKRTPPGIMGDDFTPYLKALKDIDYKGNISLECSWNKFEQELNTGVAELRKQINNLKMD